MSTSTKTRTEDERHSITARDDWDRRGPRSPLIDLVLPVSRVWIHHTGSSMPAGYHEERPHRKETRIVERHELAEVRDYHMDVRKWNYIAYCYMAFPTGNLYQCRGMHIGAHTEGDNSSSIGICFFGNFEHEVPEHEAIDSVEWLINRLQRNGKLTLATVSIDGHFRAPGAATACPGDHLIAKLDRIRRKVAAR